MILNSTYNVIFIGGDEDSENTANYTMKERQSMNMSYLQSLPPNSLVVLDDNDQVIMNLCNTAKVAYYDHISGVQD